MQEQQIHWRGPGLTRVPFGLYADAATAQLAPRFGEEHFVAQRDLCRR